MKNLKYLMIGVVSLLLSSCELTLNKEELKFVHNTLVKRMTQEKFCEEFPKAVEQFMDEPFTNWAESRIVHYQRDAWDDIFSGNSLWAEIQKKNDRKVNAANDILKGYTQNVINHIEEVFIFFNEQAEKDIYATIGAINYLYNLYEMYDYCVTYHDSFGAEDSMKVYYRETYKPILEHFSNTQEMMEVWTSNMIKGLSGQISINNVYDQAFGYYKDTSVNPFTYEENKYKIIDALVISYIGNFLRWNFEYAKINEKDDHVLDKISPKIDYIVNAYGSIDENGNTIENDNVWVIGYDNQQAFIVTLINNKDKMRMVSEPIEYDVTLVGEGLDMIN